MKEYVGTLPIDETYSRYLLLKFYLRILIREKIEHLRTDSLYRQEINKFFE